jgi:hypothetical protein
VDSVAQARRDSVDREVNDAFGALVRFSVTVATQQLDLEVIQWIEIGSTALDRTRERRFVVQELRAPGFWAVYACTLVTRDLDRRIESVRSGVSRIPARVVSGEIYAFLIS